jgi:hypothetical protein
VDFDDSGSGGSILGYGEFVVSVALEETDFALQSSLAGQLATGYRTADNQVPDRLAPKPTVEDLSFKTQHGAIRLMPIAPYGLCHCVGFIPLKLFID